MTKTEATIIRPSGKTTTLTVTGEALPVKGDYYAEGPRGARYLMVKAAYEGTTTFTACKLGGGSLKNDMGHDAFFVRHADGTFEQRRAVCLDENTGRWGHVPYTV